MVRIFPAALIAALAVSAPVLAQTTVPAATMPGSAAAAGITEVDRQFMVQDASGGAYEIALAALAQQRSSRDDIKAYAAMLIQDHAEYNAALQQLARAKGVTLPTEMSADDRTKLNSINLQGGSTLDRSFVLEATRINEEDKKAAQEEAATTKDPDIKSFLQRFAAIDTKHEQAAKALAR